MTTPVEDRLMASLDQLARTVDRPAPEWSDLDLPAPEGPQVPNRRWVAAAAMVALAAGSVGGVWWLNGTGGSSTPASAPTSTAQPQHQSIPHERLPLWPDDSTPTKGGADAVAIVFARDVLGTQPSSAEIHSATEQAATVALAVPGIRDDLAVHLRQLPLGWFVVGVGEPSDLRAAGAAPTVFTFRPPPNTTTVEARWGAGLLEESRMLSDSEVSTNSIAIDGTVSSMLLIYRDADGQPVGATGSSFTPVGLEPSTASTTIASN